jgi:hypothetical protein
MGTLGAPQRAPQNQFQALLDERDEGGLSSGRLIARTPQQRVV